MVTSKQIKEKFRDSRRSFTHNWNLFKENKVGLLGLGIMIAFILIAAASPFMGLKHPIDWFAPDEDVVNVENFLDQTTNGIVTNSAAARIIPSANAKQVDRFYVAGGLPLSDMNSVISPYGLYAKSSADGSKAWRGWSGAFETNSEITTNVEAMNFGAKRSPNGMDFRLLFGTQSGVLYLLHDGLDSEYPPSGDDVETFILGASVSGVDIYQDAVSTLNSDDLFAASTESGSLYIIDGSYTIRATIQVSNSTLTQPAISSTGEQVYVGSSDGIIYAFNTSDGTKIGEYDLYDPLYDYPGDNPGEIAANDRRDHWSSFPVCAATNVYASTDDGRVHVLTADLTPLTGWEGGYKIDVTLTELDLGNLTSPSVRADGDELVVGSDTGHIYRLSTTARVDTAESMVKMDFDTTLKGVLDTSCVAAPYYDSVYSRLIFVAVKNTNDTATPTDDFTQIYGLDATGIVKWRKNLQGVTFGSPIVYDDFALETSQHIGEGEVVIVTSYLDSDGNPMPGKVYSHRCTGTMIAPLKPTWAVPDDEKPASGIEYPLGTDAQGRDILSQLLLGSRIALLVGFAAAIFSISIGMLVGLVSGYYGGNVDIILMRFTDVILTLPGLPLLIILAALMEPSVFNIVFIIGIVGWGGTARVIRSEVLTLKERPFIDSARVTGASKTRIMFRHIAPNILPLAVLYMTFYVSGAILSEASLSFIGLGDPRTMSWGMMLNFVQHANALTAWWWLLPPGICITLICLSFFLLGRAFDEIVNPRLRRR